MIDFNIDEIEACCESLIADELEYLAPAGMNDSVKVKAFIARLRKAEKDAARWRFLAESPSSSITLRIHNSRCDQRDSVIDEAMQCNK